MRQPITARVKGFFGLFNLTEFEARLLVFLRDHVEERLSVALDDQVGRFNFVHRIIDSGDPRLEYGFTDFYYKRWHRVLRFPKLLPGLEGHDEHILLTCKVRDERDNEINCRFIAVRGALFEIQYRSVQRVWYPSGAYAIEPEAL